ncbi:MAG: nucleotidyltransferase family protein [Armatimonadetes bacterium]|nr:nucleotidyltransferase family protein [Armatimonadota bacterium]
MHLDDILILAGGRTDDEWRDATGIEWRADVEIDGKSMLEHVLQATRPLHEPLLIGGPDGISHRQLPSGENFIDSLKKGLENAEGEKVLLVTVDIPFITTEGLQEFLDAAPTDAGIAYPIIRSEACQEAFPELPRTTLKLAEGEFTGGNIALITRSKMLEAIPVIERAYAARKSPIKLASIVGWDTLSAVLVGKFFPQKLKIADLETKVSKFLGISVRGVISNDAAIGTDIDRYEHYRIITSLKESQNRPKTKV